MALDKLVDSTQLDADLASVANAIRTKGGTSAQLQFPSGFVSAVEAISGGGGDYGTSISSGNEMIIPKVDGKTSFAAFVEADSDDLVNGRALFAFKLPFLSSDRIYSGKTSSTASPPTIQCGPHVAIFVTETSSTVKVKFPNTNTVGSLPNGMTIHYCWW